MPGAVKFWWDRTHRCRTGERGSAGAGHPPGDLVWEFSYPSPTFGGVLSTASGLVFAGDHEGNFMALCGDGNNLWHYQTVLEFGAGDDFHVGKSPVSFDTSERLDSICTTRMRSISVTI